MYIGLQIMLIYSVRSFLKANIILSKKVVLNDNFKFGCERVDVSLQVIFICLNRLTPPYMLTLMFYVVLFQYWYDGPFWPQHGIEENYCRDTWWSNLIYVNNFVKNGNGVTWP